MKQLLSACKSIKEKKIIHRDIKPENILMRTKKEANCALSDFGLAQSANSEVYMYPKCGTPGFVAPEVLNFKKKTSKKYDY